MDSIKILVNTIIDDDNEGLLGFLYLIHHIITMGTSANDIHVDIIVTIKNQTQIKKISGFDFNYTFNYENIVPLNKSNKNLIIVFQNKASFSAKNYFPDYILSNAPGLDDIIRRKSCANLKGLSHTGFPGEWNKLYDVHNKIIKHVIRHEIPYIVTTPFESFDVLLSDAHQISPDLHEIIVQESFKMITCQISPFTPFNILQFAKNLGRFKNKYELIKQLRFEYKGQIQEVIPVMEGWIKQTCIVYIDDIIKSSHTHESAEILFTDYEEIIKYLYQITIALYEMGMPCLDESETRLRYDIDGNPCELFPDAFEKFKHIGKFVMTDNIIASIKLIKLLEADNVL